MISPVKIWRRQQKIKERLGMKGKIVTWTTIYVAGINFKQFAPYPVVLVELKNKERVYGQLVDFENEHLKIGQPVIAILRKIRQPSEEGVIAYGIKFKPLP